jgi:hypothetical protein
MDMNLIDSRAGSTSPVTVLVEKPFGSFSKRTFLPLAFLP